MKISNPHALSHKVLGYTVGQWTAIKNAVTAELQGRDDEQAIDEADLRGVAPELSDDRVWNQIRADLSLEEH